MSPEARWFGFNVCRGPHWLDGPPLLKSTHAPAGPKSTATSVIAGVVGGVGGGGGPSSFTIVPLACGSRIVAPTGVFRYIRNHSFTSCAVSPMTGTLIVRVVVPGGNVSVPEVAT